MLCNADTRCHTNATNTTLTFHFDSDTSRMHSAALAFGTCDYVSVLVGVRIVVEIVSSDSARGTGYFTARATSGRNYAVAYREDCGPNGLRLIAPSSEFKEHLPAGFDRFVWANLCPSCGNASAFVSNYHKQINMPKEPLSCCGTAVDETEGAPGPPGTSARTAVPNIKPSSQIRIVRRRSRRLWHVHRIPVWRGPWPAHRTSLLSMDSRAV